VDVLTNAVICCLMLVTWCHKKKTPGGDAPGVQRLAGLRLGG
jgi:hypothetical protein